MQGNGHRNKLLAIDNIARKHTCGHWISLTQYGHADSWNFKNSADRHGRYVKIYLIYLLHYENSYYILLFINFNKSVSTFCMLEKKCEQKSLCLS